MRDEIYDKDVNSCIKTVEELLENTKHIHQIIDEQKKVSDKKHYFLWKR